MAISHFLTKNVRVATNLSKLLRSSGNKAYPLKLNSSLELDVYCHMTNDLGTCEGGGWTLVMKIDGDKVEVSLFISLGTADELNLFKTTPNKA